MHPMLNTAVKAARRAATVINRASFDLDRSQRVRTQNRKKDGISDVIRLDVTEKDSRPDPTVD